MPTEIPAPRERDFQRSVVQLAEFFGWKVYHVADVKGRLRARSSVGYPDLTLLRDGTMIVAECKRDGLHPTDRQQQWLEAFALVPGVRAFCWRPADWPEIEALLTLAASRNAAGSGGVRRQPYLW